MSYVGQVAGVTGGPRRKKPVLLAEVATWLALCLSAPAAAGAECPTSVLFPPVKENQEPSRVRTVRRQLRRCHQVADATAERIRSSSPIEFIVGTTTGLLVNWPGAATTVTLRVPIDSLS